MKSDERDGRDSIAVKAGLFLLITVAIFWAMGETDPATSRVTAITAGSVVTISIVALAAVTSWLLLPLLSSLFIFACVFMSHEPYIKVEVHGQSTDHSGTAMRGAGEILMLHEGFDELGELK